MANIVFREIITGLQLLIKCLYIYINYLISPAAPLSRGGCKAPTSEARIFIITSGKTLNFTPI